ncbi:MAG: hypothetical protein H0T53_11595 [Herpetosiphonaceae bacterium]|nr:hypothetical protein [Herpetosiphonaceae bacterium]
MQKRKAAANVFMEQNVIQEAEESMADPVPEQPGYYPAPAAPAPLMQAQESGGMPPPPPPRPVTRAKKAAPLALLKTSEELQLEKEPLPVRETGLFFWRRVIVPPNAYVVHTRIGRAEPVTLGLGMSFRYVPNTDAYLVVPAAMQTIGIVANCISKEKQGINILAYVQWQIHDFAVAYRKLDFSDARDPLGIVNAQLREQAEAAIKDKIATMSVEEVLTDKEPIIEELTTRLKSVSEGLNKREQTVDEGLGIKIVTVQIKEAIVSSQRLWQDLQSPFRYEQEQIARISYLAMQERIRQKELETRQVAETSEAETLAVIERIKQTKQTEALEVRLREEALRFTREQETSRQKLQLQEQTTLLQRESEQRLQDQAARVAQETRLETLRREQAEALERTRLDAEASARQKTLQVEQALQILAEENRLAEITLQSDQQALARETARKEQEAAFNLQVQAQDEALEQRILATMLARVRQERLQELELEEATNRVRLAEAEQEVGITRLQQEVRNMINERDLSQRLIEVLPTLASNMPEIHELKVLQTGPDGDAFGGLSRFLSTMLGLGENLGLRRPADSAVIEE